ncbi:MAG: glycosyltransferase family 4 protein [Aulosira sp. ZfuVER01]|nr:glycosyltransferase family 4 protein [Aulosira sp. ZfuVER01]MDZ7998062.1 glycosyltransferase family 4 protein [Aulosira sp. DedVER01a]MDZ8050456.1 glycosyltransferase family 4 protein [Aulosira sp. ZfuCHP01]
MRVTFVISSLTFGGAERVMSIMANYWAAQGWEITVLTLDDTKIPDFYLDSRVSYIPLNLYKKSPNALIGIWSNLQRILTLRSAISQNKPHTVISFMTQTNIITLLATRLLGIPVIVSERNYPLRHSIGMGWQQLRQLTYPFAERIVVQTQRIKNFFPSQLQSRVCIIPNPVLAPPKAQASSDKLLDPRSLIAVGRLHQQKGFDLLLQAFAKLKDIYPEWKLTILGEGSLLPELEALRNQLELGDRVHFLGPVKNVYGFLKQAELFIMSSRFEGFPNALAEAMACGLPVISTDCPSGPQEIIRNGIDGILVPNEDVSALAQAMDKLMSDESQRKSLAARAPEIIERFSLEKIMGMWETLLEEVAIKKTITI